MKPEFQLTATGEFYLWAQANGLQTDAKSLKIALSRYRKRIEQSKTRLNRNIEGLK